MSGAISRPLVVEMPIFFAENVGYGLNFHILKSGKVLVGIGGLKLEISKPLAVYG